MGVRVRLSVGAPKIIGEKLKMIMTSIGIGITYVTALTIAYKRSNKKYKKK